MIIKQFHDKPLAHLSYAILCSNEIALIDPARNPNPYYDFAKNHNAKIIAVIETHPHADFVSSHLEISQTTGAKIYVSKLAGASYPHTNFDDGDELNVGKCKLNAMNTPGHSPDSICILLKNENNNDEAIFTGDTLFVGDVGRPDLRESVGNIKEKKEVLARKMYHSVKKLIKLDKNTIIYPSHGAGSLCGKALGSELQSTIGKEIRTNSSLQIKDENTFVSNLLDNQPFVPAYFEFDVELNKKGAGNLKSSLEKISEISSTTSISKNVLAVDIRTADTFCKGHLKGALNIPNLESNKFETWFGTVIYPDEKFYLIGDNKTELENAKERIAKIGYEINCIGTIFHKDNNELSNIILLNTVLKNPDKYNIIDVRSPSEHSENRKFSESFNFPLPALRDQLKNIPLNKPLVIHCQTGYRSAIATSIIKREINDNEIFDLGKEILNF